MNVSLGLQFLQHRHTPPAHTAGRTTRWPPIGPAQTALTGRVGLGREVGGTEGFSGVGAWPLGFFISHGEARREHGTEGTNAALSSGGRNTWPSSMIVRQVGKEASMLGETMAVHTWKKTTRRGMHTRLCLSTHVPQCEYHTPSIMVNCVRHFVHDKLGGNVSNGFLHHTQFVYLSCVPDNAYNSLHKKVYADMSFRTWFGQSNYVHGIAHGSLFSIIGYGLAIVHLSLRAHGLIFMTCVLSSSHTVRS